MSQANTVNASQMVTALEQAGLRPTRPRGAIINQIAAWASQSADFTSEALWHAAQEHAPWLGRSTVFRTVELLVDLGFLDRVTFADGSERYHAVQPGTHHHHLTCEECHRVVAVDVCIPESLLAAVAQQSGFTLAGHRIELFGRCPDCQCPATAQATEPRP